MEATLLPESWNVDQILDDLDQHGFTLTGHSLNLYGYCSNQECKDAYRKK